ncbi:MAG TPA: hypothetical protein VGE42_13325, partial [Candidatus Dormibacteraeota bacterium]
MAVTASGRFGARRLAWVAAVLVAGTGAMLWMAHHRAPHPGSPLAVRLAALRGLWPADRRGPLIVLGAALLVVAVDVAVIVL